MEMEVMFLKIMKMYMDIRKRRHRRWNIRPVNKDWYSSGYQKKIFLKIKKMGTEQLFLHTRMTRPVYDLLVKLVANALRKPRQRIGPEERLSITIMYLAHAVPLQNIARDYKLGKTTVYFIILETCEIIWRLLSPIYVSEPTQSKYIDIAAECYSTWKIPNCVGAIDGKHIAVKCPKIGSSSYNYKKFDSLVLTAACDVNYTFTAVNVGCSGSSGDGGLFRTSQFREALIAETLPLPPEVPLSHTSNISFPHFFVGDSSLPLGKNIMRPYAGTHLTRREKIFNYRLSRAQRVIENCFGVLTARWRVLRTTLEWLPENCEIIVLACIALHNFIIVNDSDRVYCSEQYIDGEGTDNLSRNAEWRTDLRAAGGPLRSATSFTHIGFASASKLRDSLADYFINEGESLQDSIDLAINEPYLNNDL